MIYAHFPYRPRPEGCGCRWVFRVRAGWTRVKYVLASFLGQCHRCIIRSSSSCGCFLAKRSRSSSSRYCSMALNPQLFPNGMPVPFVNELFVLTRDGVEFEVDKIPGSVSSSSSSFITIICNLDCY
jgi:hypothetical protein